MLKLLERVVYGFHYVICAGLLLLPIANVIAIWVWPLRIFNVGFFAIITIFQAIYWPVCPLTFWHNKLRAINNPSAIPTDSFLKDVLKKFNIQVTFNQVIVIQLVIMGLVLGTFLLWL